MARNPFRRRNPRARAGALRPLNPGRPHHPPRPGSAGVPWAPPRPRHHRPGYAGQSMWPRRKVLSRQAFALQHVPTDETD